MFEDQQIPHFVVIDDLPHSANYMKHINNKLKDINDRYM